MVRDLLSSQHKKGQKALAVLIDPDHFDSGHFGEWSEKLSELPFPYIYFIGGSLLTTDEFESVVSEVKKAQPEIPAIIFPGSAYQVSDSADAILFLSLLSGRNPEYLVSQQVAAVPMLRKSNLEIIGTSYLIVDAGNATTVQYVTQTQPIPHDKPEIAVQTALAGQYFGHQLTYLDAGSGAKMPVSKQMINAVSQAVDHPVIVGGGMRSLADVQRAFDAGADIAVVGTAIENDSFTFPT